MMMTTQISFSEIINIIPLCYVFFSATYTIVNEDEEADDAVKLFEYRLDHKELHNFALQIANGMRFLEEQEITHRYYHLVAIKLNSQMQIIIYAHFIL